MGLPRAKLALCAATAMLLPLAMVLAADPPKLKEGLWLIRGQSIENPGDKHTEFTYRLCRDHAYDKSVNAQLKNVKGCNTALKSLGNGKFSSASTCAVRGITVISNGLSMYAGDSSAHFETHATYSPAYNGKAEETMTQDQEYVGKCPLGMKPGDRLYPDGLIRHQSG
ncbi:MAG: hypothetical protein JWN43_1045 [Gammaproteobacteria bacterium]|nr:hypothetical protein [Gammaproteobacteria bacterium]